MFLWVCHFSAALLWQANGAHQGTWNGNQLPRSHSLSVCPHAVVCCGLSHSGSHITSLCDLVLAPKVRRSCCLCALHILRLVAECLRILLSARCAVCSTLLIYAPSVQVQVQVTLDRRSVGQFILVSCPFWSKWPDVRFIWVTITLFFM
jgi:hypothetical protein